MLLQHSGDSDQQSVYGAEQGWLKENGRSYRLKLQAYQESQHRQAQLVQKLQAKVSCLIWFHNLKLENDKCYFTIKHYFTFTCNSGILIKERNWFGIAGNVHHPTVCWRRKKNKSVCLCPQLLKYKKRCGTLEQQVLEKTSESEKLRLSVCPTGDIHSVTKEFITASHRSFTETTHESIVGVLWFKKSTVCGNWYVVNKPVFVCVYSCSLTLTLLHSVYNVLRRNTIWMSRVNWSCWKMSRNGANKRVMCFWHWELQRNSQADRLKKGEKQKKANQPNSALRSCSLEPIGSCKFWKMRMINFLFFTWKRDTALLHLSTDDQNKSNMSLKYPRCHFIPHKPTLELNSLWKNGVSKTNGFQFVKIN